MPGLRMARPPAVPADFRLAIEAARAEIARLIMATQQVTEPAWWIQAYAWVETYKRQLLYGLAGLAVLGLAVSYYIWSRGQRELEAARALSEAVAPALTGQTEAIRSTALLEVAQRFAGTRASGQALLLAANALLQEGDAANAQRRFEQFLRDYRNSPLLNQAVFGLATALEVQGKTNEAMERYESLAERRLDSDPTVFLARLRLGRLCEARGELERARRYYEEVARATPMTILGGEARLALQTLLDAHPELATRETGTGAAPEVPGANPTVTLPASLPSTSAPATNGATP